MEECDVGILCYLSSSPGFRGILKQRYTDFIVNEIDLEGNVVHLSSLNPPSHLAATINENTEETSANKNANSAKSYASEIDSFRSLAGDVDAEALETYLSKLASGDTNSVTPIVLSPDSDKTHRTEVHRFFKENLKFLVTDTVDGPDFTSKCIRVRKISKDDERKNSRKRKDRGSSQPFDSRNSDHWPEHLGKFLRFHLYKENKDTLEALGVIGKMLGLQSRSFGFAGTKDRRAVTTQRVSVYKQPATRLSALNDRLIGIKVGDFCHVNEALVLGQLRGNQFTITLRCVVADSKEVIKESVESLGKLGFINYFGLQRFGSGSVPTHLVGAALLKGEWESAVNMILDPRTGEKECIKNAREYFKESGDIGGTLKQLPRQMVAERAVLQCLKNCPGNYLQALKSIPRTLRLMYVHSYQSYLWNHAASMRVKEYGSNEVVVGDLVYCKQNLMEDDSIENSFEPKEENGDDSAENEASVTEMKNALVKIVTQEDISSGIYTIDDVVLPMPGSRIVYPENCATQVYRDLAEKDGVNLKDSVHKVKEFSIANVSGSYRRVFQKLGDLKWELISYANSDDSLAETDLDKIMGVNLVEPNLKESGSEPQIALKLSFRLPSSAYATMAIRELLKESTSVAFHKNLTCAPK